MLLSKLAHKGDSLLSRHLLLFTVNLHTRSAHVFPTNPHPSITRSRQQVFNFTFNTSRMSKMSYGTAPQGVQILGQFEPGFEDILNDGALEFIGKLHRKFNKRRLSLLNKRVEFQKRLDAGEKLNFLESTALVREGNWTIGTLPKDLAKRRVEITGPVERKMVINALNSGADAYMADFEDSNAPNWSNQINGQTNLKAAVRRNLVLKTKDKEYKLNDELATLSVRPRGWHLSEKNIQVDGERLSGSLLDFGLYFYHNAKELISRGTGPYFYLPKLESHLEARLWNDVFIFAQNEIGLPSGTIKATVLIETILAAFEMEEILHELKEHSAGLNAGRWDYIFSCIKKFKSDPNFCIADRGLINMTVPFMRAYSLLLVKSCHKRNAPAIGGMAALIPIKNDAVANEKALNGVREDKARDAVDGFDGGWVAHPGLVKLALDEFTTVLKSRPNQIEKQRHDVDVTAADLLNFQPQKPITETGLRLNISVGIQYLGSWLAGNGCVPINNLMEDAATAEISRSQVWQWINSPLGVLDDGRNVTVDLVNTLIMEEMDKIKLMEGYSESYHQKAAQIFKEMATSPTLEEFLTLRLYENV